MAEEEQKESAVLPSAEENLESLEEEAVEDDIPRKFIKPRAPIAKLDAEKLLSSQGFPKLLTMFKTSKFRSMNAKHNLQKIMRININFHFKASTKSGDKTCSLNLI